MGRFTSQNATEHGRRGGQLSHSHLEQHYADLVLTNTSAVERVAKLIGQGFRLALALRAVKIVDHMDKERR